MKVAGTNINEPSLFFLSWMHLEKMALKFLEMNGLTGWSERFLLFKKAGQRLMQVYLQVNVGQRGIVIIQYQ